MNGYLQKFGTVTGADRNVSRLAHAVGAEDAPWARVFNSAAPSMDIPDGVGTIAGSAAGAFIGFKKGHWLLGAIAGGSLGRNLPALVMHPEQRRAAARNLVVTGVACAGSLFMRNNRALGFGVGYIAAAIATYYGGLK
jgi:phage tail tape-measure protein